MGMQKRWSRLITVDGVRYRYHVAEERTDGLTLNVCIQQADFSGQRLLSGFTKPKYGVEVGNGHLRLINIPHAVTPGVIRQLILAALERGWRPGESGLAHFRLPGEEVVPELPDPTAGAKNSN